jgi:hypothetical protein
MAANAAWSNEMERAAISLTLETAWATKGLAIRAVKHFAEALSNRLGCARDRASEKIRLKILFRVM